MSEADEAIGTALHVPLPATPVSDVRAATHRPTVLSVKGVGKSYRTFDSNLQRFAHWFGAHNSPTSEHWAVRDISFDLGAGEAIAIIGENGAGKSTLLKMITGTVRPTCGQIVRHGRISAMLELGLGFNPEFTGRQNVYMAGGLMGFSTAELHAQIGEIEEFAELHHFFDEPLRVYSSGMQARLAFAVATATRPDVLIVDEVLSVGDSYFQHKCFDRIQRYRDAGTSLIFVSHSMGSVRTLCDRVILLAPGAVLRDGPADEVIDYYNALIASRENAHLSIEQRRERNGLTVTRSGSGDVVVKTLDLVDAASRQPVHMVAVGQRLVLDATLEARTAVTRLVLGYMLRDKFGSTIWGTNTWHTQQPLIAAERPLQPGTTLRVELAFEARLGPGSYSLSYALHADETHVGANYEWVDNALVFDVMNIDHPYFIGSNWLSASFRVVA